MFDPALVVADFERATWNAVNQVLPHARVIGCLFHWKQVDVLSRNLYTHY
jgi:transposase-like protein